MVDMVDDSDGFVDSVDIDYVVDIMVKLDDLG